MATYNENKDAAKRLFRELIFSPNLAMLFVLNEKSGTVYDRCLVNRLTGTVNGNPTYSKDIGNFWGLDFDGTGDYVDLGTPTSLDFERTDAFSGLCVIDPNISAQGAILGKHTIAGTDRGWEWFITAARLPSLVLESTTGNRIEVNANAAIANGTDRMLGFSYSGSSAASGVLLYDNGAAVADTDTEDTLSATIINTSNNAYIGAQHASPPVFLMNGDIGFVALWDGRALSAVEMRRFAYLGGFL